MIIYVNRILSKKFYIYFLLLVIILAVGCGQEEEQGPSIPDGQQQENNIGDQVKPGKGDIQVSPEFAIVQEAAQKFVSNPVKLLSTDAVYELITSGREDYQLISTRNIEDYERGHIPGAIHIHRNDFSMDSTLDLLDTNKEIILYCYTANGASYVAAMLNLMGYDAYGIAIGMTEWTENREVAATEHVPRADIIYPIETSPNELGTSNQLPILDTGYSNLEEIVKTTGQAYFASGRSRWISAENLWGNVQDGSAFSPYVVLDIRSSQLYSRGHIPTAINIPYEQTMDMEILKRLPLNKRLIIVSEDGQAATQVAALYNFLGYDAATLLYGMLTWTDDPELIGRPLWDGFRDYPYSFLER